MRHMLRAAALALGMVGCLVLASSVDASPVTATVNSNVPPDPTSATVTLGSTNYSTLGGGKFVWNVAPGGNPDGLAFRDNAGGSSTSSFVSFCLELTQNISNSTLYSMVSFNLANAPVPSSSLTPMGAVAAGLMQRMWYQQITSQPTAATNPLNDSDAMAAFQMAIWELVYDSDTDLSLGTLNAPGSTIKNLAQSYLNAAVADPNGPKANLLALSLSDNPDTKVDFQDQVVEIVPEPASILAWSLIGGCFVVGHRIRRNRISA